MLADPALGPREVTRQGQWIGRGDLLKQIPRTGLVAVEQAFTNAETFSERKERMETAT